MPESTKSRGHPHQRPRQIIGISLDPDMAREVKAYAAKHGLPLKKLFEQMWHAHKKQGTSGRS